MGIFFPSPPSFLHEFPPIDFIQKSLNWMKVEKRVIYTSCLEPVLLQHRHIPRVLLLISLLQKYLIKHPLKTYHWLLSPPPMIWCLKLLASKLELVTVENSYQKVSRYLTLFRMALASTCLPWRKEIGDFTNLKCLARAQYKTSKQKHKLHGYSDAFNWNTCTL